MEFHIEPRHLTKEWARKSLYEFRRQIKEGVPGVKCFRGIMEHSGNVERPWWSEECGLVDIEGNDGRVRWEFEAPIVDVDVYLKWLEERLVERGVEFVVREKGFGERIEDVVESVKREFDAAILVNCTGIGARALCGDKELVPGRGVIVKVRSKRRLTRFYCTVECEEGGELTYVFPRGESITCGGCYMEGCWKGEAGREEVEGILKRCKEKVEEIRDAEVVDVWAGFRPVRKSGVRLEVEFVDEVAVISNFGHGGAGVTVSWGCAEAVGKLLSGLL